MRKYLISHEGKYVVLILSILGVILLYTLTFLSHTPFIQIKDIMLYEGKEVTIQGVVINYQQLKYGRGVVTLIDPDDTNQTATVFSDVNLDVLYGDLVKITGQVQRYKEIYEVVLDKTENIKVISRGEDVIIPIKQLSMNPQHYKDLKIKTTGVITFLNNDYFYLTSSDDNNTLLILCDSTTLYNITKGDLVTVKGVFSYDSRNLRYILRTCDDTQSITIMESSKEDA
jgi:DNA/RNA endonuclease YhcR with UshA esterase domain